MGTFVWDASDLSAEVSGDAQEGIYIPPDSDATGASGAWVRQYGGHPRADWFGALPGNSAAANTTALQGAVDYLLNTDADTLRIPSGKYDYTTLNCLDSGGTVACRGSAEQRWVVDRYRRVVWCAGEAAVPLGYAEVVLVGVAR